MASSSTLSCYKLVPPLVQKFVTFQFWTSSFQERLEKKPKDKRNLHLLRVGIIRPGTMAAGDMSESDAEKRAKLAVAARTKLKNLHM